MEETITMTKKEAQMLFDRIEELNGIVEKKDEQINAMRAVLGEIAFKANKATE